MPSIKSDVVTTADNTLQIGTGSRVKIQKQDRTWMLRALELAAKGRGNTSPNPMVGAVVVNDGRVVGEGYHEAAGQAHAEVNAFREARGDASGATLYVSLEPCSFQGRTPPCVAAVIEADVSRVVVAMVDPDPRVSGDGIRALRDAGLLVEVGVLEDQARELNAAYVHHRETGRPLVSTKVAQTLDGRIATSTGHSQWITCESARARVHSMRSLSDAVMVGIGTVLADDPRLTVRHTSGSQPFRIVLDTTGRTPHHARILDPQQSQPALIYVSERADAKSRAAIESKNGMCVTVPEGGDGRLDVVSVLNDLGQRNVTDLMIEGGPCVITSFLQEREIHKYWCFVAPKLLGHGMASIGNIGINSVDDALNLEDTRIENIGDDFLISGTIAYP